jgi:hypothetical protein
MFRSVTARMEAASHLPPLRDGCTERNTSAVAEFAGKKDSMASSATVMSSGVPNTAVVLTNSSS